MSFIEEMHTKSIMNSKEFLTSKLGEPMIEDTSLEFKWMDSNHPYFNKVILSDRDWYSEGRSYIKYTVKAGKIFPEIDFILHKLEDPDKPHVEFFDMLFMISQLGEIGKLTDVYKHNYWYSISPWLNNSGETNYSSCHIDFRDSGEYMNNNGVFLPKRYEALEYFCKMV